MASPTRRGSGSVPERLATLEEQNANLTLGLSSVQATCLRIEDRMNGRPSWPVSIYLTLCTAACAALATALATAHP